MQLSEEMLRKIDFSKNRILIDWFSFSSRQDSFETLSEMLGLSNVEWQVLPGVMGYSCRYYFNGISIHEAGNNSVRFSGSSSEQVVKGAWLEMSGSGCRAFETYGNGNWNKLISYCDFYHDEITFNRLDLAYDDFLGFLDMAAIVKDTYSRNFVSKFRADPQIICTVGQSENAYTVEHGRMKSDTFIRIYDKRLEQHAEKFCSHWVRNEIMLRHDRAFAAVQLLNGRDDISNIYFMIMNNYLRYIDPSDSDSNKWRAPMAVHWRNFAESVTTYRICLWSKPGTDYSTLQLDHYIEHQTSAALYTYIKIHGIDKLIEICNSRYIFLSPKYKALLAESEIPEGDFLIE